MSVSLDAVFVISLAVWQAVLIWRSSSLFAGSRAAVESWPSWSMVRPAVLRRLARRWLARRRAYCQRVRYHCAEWLRELLLCDWCLSVWVGTLLSAAWYALPEWLWWPNVFTIGLATSRVANIMMFAAGSVAEWLEQRGDDE